MYLTPSKHDLGYYLLAITEVRRFLQLATRFAHISGGFYPTPLCRSSPGHQGFEAEHIQDTEHIHNYVTFSKFPSLTKFAHTNIYMLYFIFD